MNVTIRVDENTDGYIDPDALELILHLSEVVGSNHSEVRSDSYGVSIDIDDEGAHELLCVIREEAAR